MARKFGVEIEAYGVVASTLELALRAAGVAVLNRRMSYGTSGSGSWEITYDGSLAGLMDAFELISPPLAGREGMDEVRKVCRVLNALGAKVNTSCGLHVHVDANDFDGSAMKRLLKSFARFEYEVQRLVPKSRRAGQAALHYCRPVRRTLLRGTNVRFIGRTVAMRAMAAVEAVADTIRACQMALDCDRYHALNLMAHNEHGTVEFRQHSGTTDGAKIEAWVALCVGFVNAAMADAPLPERVTFARLLDWCVPAEYHNALNAQTSEV